MGKKNKGKKYSKPISLEEVFDVTSTTFNRSQRQNNNSTISNDLSSNSNDGDRRSSRNEGGIYTEKSITTTNNFVSTEGSKRSNNSEKTNKRRYGAQHNFKNDSDKLDSNYVVGQETSSEELHSECASDKVLANEIQDLSVSSDQSFQKMQGMQVERQSQKKSAFYDNREKNEKEKYTAGESSKGKRSGRDKGSHNDRQGVDKRNTEFSGPKYNTRNYNRRDRKDFDSQRDNGNDYRYPVGCTQQKDVENWDNEILENDNTNLNNSYPHVESTTGDQEVPCVDQNVTEELEYGQRESSQKKYGSKHKVTDKDGDQLWRNKNDRQSLPSQTSDKNWNKNFSKRYSEGNSTERNKDGWASKENSNTYHKNQYDKYSEDTDAELKEFYREEHKSEEINFIRVNEIQQDLFTIGREYSLGHCVAEDMRMGSGIAVNFKREFKDVDQLLSQRQKQGGLAVIEDKTERDRYIYYLVTKRESTGKPTYEKFWSSVKKMRDHIYEHNVKKLAIPRLGCGLDRLEWSRVKHMIEFLFRDTDVEITVCNFQQIEESPEKPQGYKQKIVNVLKSIADIEEETTIIYLSTEDSHVSNEMEELSKKFPFLMDFKKSRKQLGEVIQYKVPNKYYLLYGCIVRKTIKDPFDFISFRKCVSQINKNNRQDKYLYIGISAIKDKSEDLLLEKIITIFKNYLSNVDIYVCWYGELAGQMPESRKDRNDYYL